MMDINNIPRNHGPECRWCANKRYTGLKKGPPITLTNNFAYSHPSGSDLISTGECVNKKALLIGINYLDEIGSNRLKGCINDAMDMKEFLYKNFRVTDVRLMCDNMARSSQPSRQNILDSISWLVDGAKPGDNLFFYFSGHGRQTPDLNNEGDNLDEVIVPCDHRTEGYITDDDLYRVLVHAVPKDVTLVAIIDCCHRRTMLDLPNIHQARNRAIMSRSRQKFVKGRVVCISAATDVQTAIDVPQSTDVHGALTHALLHAIEDKKLRVTLYTLLITITATLSHFHQIPCISTTNNVQLRRFYFGIENT